ncbi:MAG TPA: hypothetical protein VM846_13685, partial [Vicinamibacterales bacterium]|nr:hypothetical protein [Vicinamibacterales bacterium]
SDDTSPEGDVGLGEELPQPAATKAPTRARAVRIRCERLRAIVNSNVAIDATTSMSLKTGL